MEFPRVSGRVSAKWFRLIDEEVGIDLRPARDATSKTEVDVGAERILPLGEILPPFVARDSLTNSCFIALFIAARHELSLAL